MTNPTNPTADKMPIKLSGDQSAALEKLKDFILSEDPIFVLKGYAGTGKTTMLHELLKLRQNDPFEGLNLYFTAPTNKAVKELAKAINEEAKTIYSLLGLRLTEDEDRGKELIETKKEYDFGIDPIIVVDEASMVSTLVLDILQKGAFLGDWRIIFVGDPAQLNPVHEEISPCWNVHTNGNEFTLREVIRYDDELLALSLHIRETKNKAELIIENDFNELTNRGVVRLGRPDWRKRITEFVLEDWDNVKVCAWRNKTVNEYNALIRKSLGFNERLCVGERVLMASNHENFSVDDEFIIGSISESVKSEITYLSNGNKAEIEIPIWQAVAEDGSVFTIARDKPALDVFLSVLANRAKQLDGYARKKAWGEFFNVRDSYHHFRYGYAMTAHRLQGSTCKSIFVDQVDVLSNPKEQEALRCMYVACTRAQESVYLI